MYAWPLRFANLHKEKDIELFRKPGLQLQRVLNRLAE